VGGVKRRWIEVFSEKVFAREEKTLGRRRKSGKGDEGYEGAIKREILRKGKFIVATKTSWIAMNSAMKKRLGLISVGLCPTTPQAL